ncbi:MAG: hypothetical protein AB1781_01750 [Pseudomonadota bacterium]
MLFRIFFLLLVSPLPAVFCPIRGNLWTVSAALKLLGDWVAAVFFRHGLSRHLWFFPFHDPKYRPAIKTEKLKMSAKASSLKKDGLLF